MPGNSNNIGHEVTNNVKTFSCRETRAKCTLCNEINVAMKNIGHEVTNITPKTSCRETGANALYAMK